MAVAIDAAFVVANAAPSFTSALASLWGMSAASKVEALRMVPSAALAEWIVYKKEAPVVLLVISIFVLVVMIALAVIIPLVALVVGVIFRFFVVIVHQGEGILALRLGEVLGVYTAGMHWYVPELIKFKQFSWQTTEAKNSGGMVTRKTSSFRVDMRESVYGFDTVEQLTKDGVVLEVKALMYYRISDIYKACYDMTDLCSALQRVVQAQLKDVFGHMTFSEALESQDVVNDHMMREYKDKYLEWGVDSLRLEILELIPQAEIGRNLKAQMIAERNRRGEFILAEGVKAKTKLESEGKKMVNILSGLASQESLRKRSQGDATAKIEIAHAESASLEVVSAEVQADGARQSDYMMSQRYMDMISSISNKAPRNIWLPYSSRAFRGVVGKLGDSFSPEAAAKAALSGPGKAQKSKPKSKSKSKSKSGTQEIEAGGEFDDLS